MSAGATLAIGGWLATGWPAARRFRRALGDVRGAQEGVLRGMLARHAHSAFGRAHDFGALRDARAFARHVPLQAWDDVAPWIARIRAGERDVLATGAVTHLAPTSGSTGARKLVPFGPALQRAFDAAIAPWMHDLARRRPAIVGGPHWWSVTPLDDDARTADAHAHPRSPPLGHGDDAEHLGGVAAALVRHAFAVPPGVQRLRDVDAFRALLLLALLRTRELRLLSIWHPSFLDLVVASAAGHWEALLDAIAHGTLPWGDALPPSARDRWRARPDPRRAQELRAIGPRDWPRWWPRMAVVSCWGEQAAEGGWRRLRDRLPHVLVQPKGLLATEGVVTIPVGDTHVLAATSHHFELLDRHGGVRLAHEVERGGEYEVVLSNGGGLWRYRLGDMVACTGRLGTAPTLRFLGRAGAVSDLRGEKLAEPFVATVLRAAAATLAPGCSLSLRARAGGDDADATAGYALLVEGTRDVALVTALVAHVEAALADNPHYALARRLGQLAPLAGVVAEETAGASALLAHAGRIGEAKPRVLVP